MLVFAIGSCYWGLLALAEDMGLLENADRFLCLATNANAAKSDAMAKSHVSDVENETWNVRIIRPSVVCLL